MLKTTIVRSEWNGNTLERLSSSMLLMYNGQMCCLGFACIAAGVDPPKLRGNGYVHELGYDAPAELSKLVEMVGDEDDIDNWNQTDVSYNLVNANDNSCNAPVFASMAEKEAYIIEQGKLAGIEFTFVD